MAAPKSVDQEFSERYDRVGANNRSSSDTRRRTADRNTNRADRTRNVRTTTRRSTMPGAPKNERFTSGKRDIATEFNESYARQGIQPSYVTTKEESAPKRKRYEQPEQIDRSQQAMEERREAAPAPPEKPKKTYKRRKNIRKKLGPKSAFAKARVTSVNIWVWSWGLYVWFFFQLPIAILSLVALSITEYVHRLMNDLETTTNEEGLIERVVEGVVIGTMTVFQKASQLLREWVGIDLSVFSPDSLAFATMMIVLAIGWTMLFLTYFMYKASLLSPVLGKGGGLKIGLLLLAVVGYATPIANIFPWFIFWTMAVWRHPK